MVPAGAVFNIIVLSVLAGTLLGWTVRDLQQTLGDFLKRRKENSSTLRRRDIFRTFELTLAIIFAILATYALIYTYVFPVCCKEITDATDRTVESTTIAR